LGGTGVTEAGLATVAEAATGRIALASHKRCQEQDLDRCVHSGQRKRLAMCVEQRCLNLLVEEQN
jgi:hypothetical protein